MAESERMYLELPPPPEAAKAQQAVEVFRGWVVDGRLFCCLNPGVLKGPAVWGVLLADAAQHVADALQEIEGKDRTESLRAIIRAFKHEMQDPTATHSGEVVRPDETDKPAE